MFCLHHQKQSRINFILCTKVRKIKIFSRKRKSAIVIISDLFISYNIVRTVPEERKKSNKIHREKNTCLIYCTYLYNSIYSDLNLSSF